MAGHVVAGLSACLLKVLAVPLTKTICARRPDASRFTVRKIVEPVLSSKLAMAISLRHPSTLTQQLFIDLIREQIRVWLGYEQAV
ncbi:hypothetical protein [Aquitalea magnusonii]|uniref:Uncharacterized protein n=1 Tax=Aquitalea magnusonii TaxID=332411 RepID=A0A318JEX2_9NEIS|nr:hypothetical protein [Aquitalea magnusonii]PXX38832.1 hypothetical protein DFR38_1325 [Aquitalea magnusonii]